MPPDGPVSSVRSRGPLVVALAFGALATVFVLYLVLSGPSRTHGPILFSLFEDGELTSYSIDQEGKVARFNRRVAFADSSFFTRFVGMKLKSGDTPVIVDSPSVDAGMLAVVRSDGTLIPLIDDGVQKYEFVSRADGHVAFSEYLADKGGWRIFSVSVYGTSPLSPVDFGPGFSSGFSGDGGLITIAPEGLVRFNPERPGRIALIDRSSMEYGVAAVSRDAKLAVLPNEVTHALDVFSLAPDDAAKVSYIASVPAEAQAVAFLTPNTFVVKTIQSFAVYAVENGAVVSKSTHTYAP